MGLFREKKVEPEVIIEEAEDKIEAARKFLEEISKYQEPTVSFSYADNLVIKPGSAEAEVAGCTCDGNANTFGKGLYIGTKNWKGKEIYALVGDCPLHGMPKM